MGSDNGYQGGGTYGNPFQSTLPGWGATDSCAHVTVFNTANFNPRSPDGERLGDGAAMAYRADISIHAPRMGSDRPASPDWIHPQDFNPRSPDGERLLAAA